MGFELGRILKRKHITQKEFQRILAEKYNHSVSKKAVNHYCSKECPSGYPCWNVVQKCLREQFNIVYLNGRWQEANVDG